MIRNFNGDDGDNSEAVVDVDYSDSNDKDFGDPDTNKSTTGVGGTKR